MANKSKDISVLAELDRYLLKYEWAGTSEVKVRCPFHEDTKPSCSVSVPERIFVCHAGSCGAKGDIVDLLAASANQPRSVILEDLSTRYELDDVKIVEPSVVERWHKRIWDAGPLLAELRKRAISDDTIKQRKIGEEGGRVTIPVPNQSGDWVNVRKYLPGASGADKMRNMRGRGSGRWYPADQLSFGTVLLVGGEMKALAAIQQLEKHGIGVISWTSEKRIPTPSLKELEGKSVYVCMDIDAAGRKAAHANLMALRPIASELHDLLLPLDITKHPKGDVNDFIAEGGDLWAVMSELQPWVAPENGAASNVDPIELHLSDSVHARNAGIRVRVKAVAVAMDIAPYPIPKEVKVKCDRSQKFCSACPVWQHDCEEFTVPPEHPAVLMSIHVDTDGLHDAMVAACGIPKQCRACEFETTAYYNAEDVRISPCLEITSRAMDQKTLPAICIGKGMEMNEPYVLTGRMLPHPRTQQSTLLISGYEQTQDALSTYSPSADDLRSLVCFQPKEWTVELLGLKLDEIYSDFEQHVTHIRCRRDMHLMMDMVWHSPLLLHIDGRPQKGWLESLVVGDSEQGKSETALGLMRHYGLGEKVECKNATAAGLMGGLQQLGNGRWFASWGFLPMHDKRMVFLEELKGASIESIGRLTDMRSSGIAELAKIEKRRTHARTRILAASNPRVDGRTLSSYAYGVEVIRELIGGLEDIRRFDLFYLAASGDVDPALISAPWPENGQPLYGSDLCRELVLWTWTRHAHQCVLTDKVRDLCTQCAIDYPKNSPNPFQSLVVVQPDSK